MVDLEFKGICGIFFLLQGNTFNWLVSFIMTGHFLRSVSFFPIIIIILTVFLKIFSFGFILLFVFFFSTEDQSAISSSINVFLTDLVSRFLKDIQLITKTILVSILSLWSCYFLFTFENVSFRLDWLIFIYWYM